jgi:uncharacterized membrane protein
MAGKSADERIEAKQKRQKTMIAGIAVGVIIIVALIAGFVLLKGSQGGNTATYNQSQADSGGQNVRISLSDIADNNFHYYTYDNSGTAIKYFVVKDNSGAIHTAFDACDICYEAKKGYSQVGDKAKCINCGKVFAIAGIGTENVAGGCWPGYLPHEIRGNDLIIKNTDLERGKHYFE